MRKAPEGRTRQWERYQRAEQDNEKGTRGQNKTVGKAPAGRTRQWERHRRAEQDSGKGTRGQNKTMGQAPEGRTRQWERHQRAKKTMGNYFFYAMFLFSKRALLFVRFLGFARLSFW